MAEWLHCSCLTRSSACVSRVSGVWSKFSLSVVDSLVYQKGFRQPLDFYHVFLFVVIMSSRCLSIFHYNNLCLSNIDIILSKAQNLTQIKKKMALPHLAAWFPFWNLKDNRCSSKRGGDRTSLFTPLQFRPYLKWKLSLNLWPDSKG